MNSKIVLSRRQKLLGLTVRAALGLFLPALASAQDPAQIDGSSTYFEFGTVVSIGRTAVDVQTFDSQHQKSSLHTFLLTGETRADVVRPGDAVEVIFVPQGAAWTLRRLMALPGGIPKAGSPPQQSAPHPAAITPNRSGADRRASNSTLPVLTPRNSKAPVAVDLGNTAKPKVPAVISVPMGVPEDAKSHRNAPGRREIARDTPSEECNRSNQDWPSQPISIAILDFRYPTEREESHDSGTTGGGSGTAVADLVFDRLEPRTEISYRRGDRDKLYRGDFAGAARLGRQLGVDAVLAGTFQPVEVPDTPDGFPGPKTYELRAGMVDTCTGQLLMRLSSAVCPGGIDIGATSNGCTRYSVTARQASDPKDASGSFKQSLDALLVPLEHAGTPLDQHGTAGMLTGVDHGTATIRLERGAKLKAGDQVAIHAWRLAKNPTTYTLHLLRDEEIGRVTLTKIQGGMGSGIFVGDFEPKVGDAADLISDP